MRLVYLDRKKFKSSLAEDGSYFINCAGYVSLQEALNELMAKAGNRCFELRTKEWFDCWGPMLSKLSNSRICKYDLLTDEAVATIVSTLVVQQPKNVYTYKNDPIWSTKQGEELKATLETLCKDQ